MPQDEQQGFAAVVGGITGKVKNTLMDTTLKRVSVVSGFIILAVFLSYVNGRSNAKTSIEHLALVWPDLHHLPDDDRAFLAVLAITCKLNSEELNADKTIECLKRSVVDPNLILPKGEERVNASAHLQRLISMNVTKQ